MAIPNVTPYSGQKPIPGQDQPTFNQNMSDELDYFNALPAELNTAINAMNQTATDVDDAKTAAEAAASEAENSAVKADLAADAAGYKGEWYADAPVELGDIWGYEGSEWRSLTGADVEPVEGLDWRSINDHSNLTNRDEQGSHPASAIVTSNGESVQNRLDKTTKNYQSVSEMLADFELINVGDVLSTGESKWEKLQEGDGSEISHYRCLNWVSLNDLGADKSGVNDSSSAFAFAEENFDSYLIPHDATYLISDITLTKTLMFMKGGKIKSRTANVTVSGEIQAGDWVIFDTEQDFYSNLPYSFHADPFIKIKGQRSVRVDWFGECKTQNKQLIKTVPDATKYITQAFRAATGNYIPYASRPGDFIGETVNQNVGLGAGYYNLEKMLRWAISDEGSTYWSSGTGLIGNGVNSSYLIASELKFGFGQPAVQITNFTGQINPFSGFRVETYAPHTATPFSGEFAAMLWFSAGDSLQLNNVWAAGAQVGVDNGDGFLRNGVGIQFYSVVDVQGSNIFSEHNVYNYGVYSAAVSIANIESFGSREAAIVFGLPAENFAYPQGPSNSILNATGGEFHNCRNECVLALEGNSTLNLSNFRADGTGESGGPVVGRYFALAKNYASLKGCVTGFDIAKFTVGTLKAIDDASFGDSGTTFVMTGGALRDITATQTTGRTAVVSLSQSSSDTHNVVFGNLSINNCQPQIIDGMGNVDVSNVRLKSFVGITDAGPTRHMFLWRGGALRLTNISRENDNSVQLTQYGFNNEGNVHIDILETELAGATRIVTGTGTTVKPATSAFS